MKKKKDLLHSCDVRHTTKQVSRLKNVCDACSSWKIIFEIQARIFAVLWYYH